MNFSTSDSRKYAIWTFGCQMNLNDSERIAGVLESRGMIRTQDVELADIVVINTCCIRENADNKFYGSLSRLKPIKDGRPGMQIAVGGCLAQKDREDIIRRSPYVDVLFGTHNIPRVADLLDQALSTGGHVVEILEGPDEESPNAFQIPTVRSSLHSSWVTIQTGCNNSCSFCIVPSVRGKEVSRPMEEIKAEVTQLAKTGVTEITLLGQNVNSYGRDITKRSPLFAELLYELGAVNGIRRIRFTSPHPKDFRLETALAMAQVPQVCEQLHLPMQSGSDHILAKMRRGYTGQRYLEKVAMARSAIADLALTTDIIVGFPGETEEDFEDTLKVASQARFDGAFTFIFSARPGTRAEKMNESYVDPEVISERFERLKIVIDRSSHQSNLVRVGKVEEVLIEGPSKKNPEYLTGRTRQNKLVHFGVDAEFACEDIGGHYGSVAIESCSPHFLRGTLVSLQTQPRNRKSLPILVG